MGTERSCQRSSRALRVEELTAPSQTLTSPLRLPQDPPPSPKEPREAFCRFPLLLSPGFVSAVAAGMGGFGVLGSPPGHPKLQTAPSPCCKAASPPLLIPCEAKSARHVRQPHSHLMGSRQQFWPISTSLSTGLREICGVRASKGFSVLSQHPEAPAESWAVPGGG